jgi:hypothetical protein
MHDGDVQQGGTIGRGKGCLNVGTGALMVSQCMANEGVAVLRMRIPAFSGRDAAESFLSLVVVLAPAARVRRLQL